jgi:hypothetical protein
MQSDVAAMEEFRDSVRFAETAKYVVKDGDSFDGGYHYYGRADTFFHIGQSFGEAILNLQ